MITDEGIRALGNMKQELETLIDAIRLITG